MAATSTAELNEKVDAVQTILLLRRKIVLLEKHARNCTAILIRRSSTLIDVYTENPPGV
jgi:hypothetical protein